LHVDAQCHYLTSDGWQQNWWMDQGRNGKPEEPAKNGEKKRQPLRRDCLFIVRFAGVAQARYLSFAATQPAARITALPKSSV
jgi:hypothetical protein